MLQNSNEYSPQFNSAPFVEKIEDQIKAQQKKLTYEEESTSETELLQINCKDYVLKKYASPQKQLSLLLDDVESSSNTHCRTSSEKKILEMLAPPGRDSYCNSNQNNISVQIGNQVIGQATKCPEHTDEDLLFICFSCERKCVCIECISNGQHKNHDIKNIKKAKREIKQLVQEILVKLKSKIENYAVESDKLDGKKNEIVEIANELKKSIRFNFEELREILAKKEQELLTSADEFLIAKANIIDQSLVRLRRRMNIFIESHRLVEEYIAELDETSLCNYFYKKSKILNELVEEGSSMHGLFSETKKIEKTLKEAFDFQCFFDSKALKNYLESIQLIKIESASLRGVESISASSIDGNKVTFSGIQNIGQGQGAVTGSGNNSSGSKSSSRGGVGLLGQQLENYNDFEQEQMPADLNENNSSQFNSGLHNINTADINFNGGYNLTNSGSVANNFNSYNNTTNYEGNSNNGLKNLSANVIQLKKKLEKGFNSIIKLNNNNNVNCNGGLQNSNSSKNLQLLSILSPPSTSHQQGKNTQSPQQNVICNNNKLNLNDFWNCQQQKLKKNLSQPKINPFSVQQQSPFEKKIKRSNGKDQQCGGGGGSTSTKKLDINQLFDNSTPSNYQQNSGNNSLNNSIFNSSQFIKQINHHQNQTHNMNDQIHQLQEDLSRTLNRDNSSIQLLLQNENNQQSQQIKCSKNNSNVSQLDEYQQNIQKMRRERQKNYSLHQLDQNLKLPNFQQFKRLQQNVQFTNQK